MGVSALHQALRRQISQTLNRDSIRSGRSFRFIAKTYPFAWEVSESDANLLTKKKREAKRGSRFARSCRRYQEAAKFKHHSMQVLPTRIRARDSYFDPLYAFDFCVHGQARRHHQMPSNCDR